MRTFTIATWHLPQRTFARVIESGDPLPQRFLEVTGPAEAFTLQDVGPHGLLLRVDRPELVDVKPCELAR